MTEYRNVPEKFAQFKRPFISVLGIFLALLIVLIMISYFTETRGTDSFKQDVCFLVIICAISFCVSYYTATKRQRRSFDSYQLAIGHDYIIRKQSDFSDMTLYFNEIVSISEYKGGLIIKAREPDKVLIVSRHIEDYESVKTHLSSLCPILPFSYKGLFTQYPFLLSIIMVIGMVGVYITDNKIVVCISGGVVLLIMGWMYYKTKTNKYLDSYSKKSLWLYLLLAFVIITAILTKLSIK
jgi:hypothetical protein